MVSWIVSLFIRQVNLFFALRGVFLDDRDDISSPGSTISYLVRIDLIFLFYLSYPRINWVVGVRLRWNECYPHSPNVDDETYDAVNIEWAVVSVADLQGVVTRSDIFHDGSRIISFLIKIGPNPVSMTRIFGLVDDKGQCSRAFCICDEP